MKPWVSLAATLGLAVTACGGESRVDAASGSGGQGGASPSSGGTAGDGEGGAAVEVRCPEGLPGPRMVGIPAPSGPFCIDSAETSMGEFNTFAETEPSLANQPVGCGFSKEVFKFDPKHFKLALPAMVNWCQASLYCAWAGKRLCSKIGTGGGPVDYTTGFDDPRESEWFFACTRGGARLYPYGNVFEPEPCNDGRRWDWAEGDWPTTQESCEGGFPGLFDMSGNAQEWENGCAEPPDPTWPVWQEGDLLCRVRSRPGLEDDMRCNSDYLSPRAYYAGIRCCVGALPPEGPGR
jgi:formylglycine-generating enzyme